MPWQYDGNLSKVEWSVRYLGIATVKGWFRDVQVSLDLDPESPLDWKTSITIAAASVYTGIRASWPGSPAASVTG